MTPTAPPDGSALAPLVDVLLAAPLTGLTVPELKAAITTVTPQVARLQGWLHAAAGELDARTGGNVPDDDTGRPRTVAGWLAQTRHATASSAGSQLRTARLLQQLPLVVAAVLDGILTPVQAAVLTRFVGTIDPDGLAESQPHLIAVAATMDPAQLGVWVAHQIATHCEPALEADQASAHAKRYLTSRREADGSLSGRFRLTAEDSETLLTALEPLARKAGEQDHRTAGQRRADALVELSEQVLRHGQLPDAGGLRPQLSYVLPADWAAQQAQAACTACGPRCPDHRPLTFTDTVEAALPGHGGTRAEQACATAAWTGPQTRARLEAMLCDARITRVLLTPTGQVRGLEPLRDSITPAQRRALAARDITCTTRGCTRPPAMCDAHHLVRRSDGGPTTLDNMICSADDTTSCGTRARSSSTTSPSPGTPTSSTHHHIPSTTSSREPADDGTSPREVASAPVASERLATAATGRTFRSDRCTRRRPEGGDMAQATSTRPDVQEMVIVHRMFRREYELAPVLVRGVAAGDRARAQVVAAHLTEVCTMLHHHHAGEDDLVWPRLHERTPVSSELVQRMEDQHVRVGGLLEQVEHLLPAWAASPDESRREALASVLDDLGPALAEHLAEEEREVLPLIEQHLSVAEWNQLGERAVAAIPKARMLVLMGYVLEQTTPDERRTMLGVLPPPVRLIYRGFGQRKHLKERNAIRAGAVPAQRTS